MNKKAITLGLMLVILTQPVCALDNITIGSAQLYIEPINNITVTVGEPVKFNITAILDMGGNIGLTKTTPGKAIGLSIKNLPEGSTISEIESSPLKTTYSFEYVPHTPEEHTIIIIAQSWVFGITSVEETVQITVIPKEDKPSPTPSPTTRSNGNGIGIYTGSGGVGPIHPTGMYMHGLWGMMNTIEEHTNTTRDTLENMTHFEVVKLYFKVLVALK